jgi:hypothetical protein
LAALRVRNLIFDVLRFGTPIRAAYQSMFFPKDKRRGVQELKRKSLSL